MRAGGGVSLMTDLPPSLAPDPPMQPAVVATPEAPSRLTWRAMLRLVVWTMLSALVVGGLAAWFYLLRGERLTQRLEMLHAGWMGLAAACMGIWALLATRPPEALRLSPQLSKRVLIVTSAVLALAALAWLRPVLSSEVLRYRFDGRAWLLGLNPYTVSPEEAVAIAADSQDPEFRPDGLDLAAPHPQRTTLNLPVSQAGFVATRTLEYLSPAANTEPAGEVIPPFAADSTTAQAQGSTYWRGHLLSLPWWRQLFFWRCLLAGAFLLAVGELIAWLRYRELSPWWAVLFAWQPLVLMETLGAAHQDMLGVLFLIAGLRRADAGNVRRAAMCLAASVAVKPLALLVLPFVIRRAWGRDASASEPAQRLAAPPSSPTAARRLMVWFFLTLILLLTPLYGAAALTEAGRAVGGYFAGAGQDAALSRALEAIFAGEQASEGRIARVRLAAWMICALAALLTGLIAWQRRVGPAAAFYAMMIAGLLLSPVAAPWLLLWPLALVPIMRGRAGPAALVWAGTAGLYYLPETLAGGRVPSAMVALQFAPVYAVALLEAVATRRQWLRIRRRQPGTLAGG